MSRFVFVTTEVPRGTTVRVTCWTHDYSHACHATITGQRNSTKGLPRAKYVLCLQVSRNSVVHLFVSIGIAISCFQNVTKLACENYGLVATMYFRCQSDRYHDKVPSLPLGIALLRRSKNFLPKNPIS